MRFTSLIVELIRGRPRLVFGVVVLFQAALWLMVPLLVYRAPPGDLATVLAFGREYRVGTDLGPPLPFWLADIAFRLAGGHMIGVYLLAQLCFVVTFEALFRLGRAIVGGQHAVVAVLLTLTVTAFSAPGDAFGPAVLARPLWALVLLHSWQIIGQGRRNAWFAFSIEAGLLLLTTPAAIGLLLLVLGFAVATARGRRTLLSFDPLFALLVVVVLVLPYAIWLLRAGVLTLPVVPSTALSERASHGAMLAGGLLLSMAGLALLVFLNWRRVVPNPDKAPIIFRPPVDPLARDFVYVFAVAPALAACAIAGLFDLPSVLGGVVLLPVGLAVVIATGDLIYLRRHRVLRSAWAIAIVAPAIAVVTIVVMSPWVGGAEIATSLPAKPIAKFFGESFERRTGRPLQAVAGDPQLASLVSLGTTRPHLYLDATPQRTPWVTASSFQQTGGVVVWRASDTASSVPDDIARHFPGIVPEVPRAFDRLVNGRLPPLRIGWGIVRPKPPQ